MAIVTLVPLVLSTVPVGGSPATVLYGPMAGGVIANPASAADQGLSAPEPLLVDFIGNAAAVAGGTTFSLLPGESVLIPANQTTNVSVNATSDGHRFSGFAIQDRPPAPIPQIGPFPPLALTTVTRVIRSYLYQEYNDDEDLQAFVAAYNTMAQAYVDLLNALSLPDYTGAIIKGTLLDWVAAGLYGITRPSLPEGGAQYVGPFNTYVFNPIKPTVPFNGFLVEGTTTFTPTSDDFFKRIITWHFYKGDGRYFSIPWLKRRIMRFLYGANGVAVPIDNTYPVDVQIADGVATITLSVYAPFFAEAVRAGVLELPFQYSWIVTFV